MPVVSDHCEICGEIKQLKPYTDKLDGERLRWVCEECLTLDPGRFGIPFILEKEEFIDFVRRSPWICDYCSSTK